MKHFIYYGIYFVFYVISLLPFSILYRVSDFLYLMVYHVLKYRRSVVLQNLTNSFPDKSEEENHHICKEFYKYFCDLIIEIVKLLSLSKEEVVRRCSMEPDAIKLMNDLYDSKKNFIIVMGHLGNWELANHAFNLHCSNQLYAIYRPFSNKYFDRLIIQLRSKWGTKLIPLDDTYKQMKRLENRGNAAVFLADQTPQPDNAYWTTFLNQDTPVYRGTEILAKRLDFPVVYLGIKRPKRGFYRFYMEELIHDPKLTKTGQISEAHTRRLEQDIQEQPQIWLWSHRRWKHQKPTIKLKNEHTHSGTVHHVGGINYIHHAALLK